MRVIPSREEAAGTNFAKLWDTPDHWPRDVHRMPLEHFDKFGVHFRTREMYWDGQKLITEKRWGDTERSIAMVGLLIAAIGVGATVVQAWAAISPRGETNFQTCLQTFERGWVEANGSLSGFDRIKSIAACEDAL